MPPAMTGLWHRSTCAPAVAGNRCVIQPARSERPPDFSAGLHAPHDHSRSRTDLQ